ncbi:hypothetical protein SDC9_130934 [bioreactor metagenome]|uniref:Uncharacterized protein n=1 Tax=bioreactor metagenome TaxID=1076179 RepID=A0A645D3U9_9ZZZZ
MKSRPGGWCSGPPALFKTPIENDVPNFDLTHDLSMIEFPFERRAVFGRPEKNWAVYPQLCGIIYSHHRLRGAVSDLLLPGLHALCRQQSPVLDAGGGADVLSLAGAAGGLLCPAGEGSRILYIAV